MAIILLLAFLASLGICVCLTWFVLRLSVRIGFVDRPGGHKQHRAPVALGGGVAVAGTVCAVMLIGAGFVRFASSSFPIEWLPSFWKPHLPGIAASWAVLLKIVGVTLFLHVVGLLDDARPLPPFWKLMLQAAAALFTAWDTQLRAVEFLPAPLSIAATALWIVLITNAFNFLDNMDGLSAGVAAIASAILALAAAAAGQVFVPLMGWVFAGSLIGLLVFNFSPAKIFMGDAGSLPIGYLMAVLTILTTYYDPGRRLSPLGMVVPLVVLAVPLYDVISVVVHRLRAGDSPFRGDRRHFSHRLVRRGMSERGAVLTIYLATAATGLSAIVLPRVEWGSAVLLLGQCVCVVVMIAVLEHVPKREE